jgi:DNA-damage-inducible protein J
MSKTRDATAIVTLTHKSIAVFFTLSVYCHANPSTTGGFAMTQINIRLDDDLKARAETLFGELGMNMTTAITVFLRQSLLRGGIPFEITTRQSVSAPPAMPSPNPATREESVFGALRQYANPSLIEREEGAWVAAVREKHAGH